MLLMSPSVSDKIRKRYERMLDPFHTAAEQRGFTLTPARRRAAERRAGPGGELGLPAARSVPGHRAASTCGDP